MEAIIADTIVHGLITGKLQSAGLFKGKMGVCISLFAISRRPGFDKYAHLASFLLKGVISDIYSMSDISFDKGLSGIAWAIDYLHRKGFVQGDIDDILYDIDALLYRQFTDDKLNADMFSTEMKVGCLLYLVPRLSNPRHDTDSFIHYIDLSLVKRIVNSLETTVMNDFKSISDDVYTSCLWRFPALFYCIGAMIEKGIYADKAVNMVNYEWAMQITGYIPFYGINKMALANSLTYLNSKIHNHYISDYIHKLYNSSVNMNIESEVDSRIMNINEGWFHALATVNKAISLNTETEYKEKLKEFKSNLLNTYMPIFKDNVGKLNKNSDVSFINGFSGILFMLATKEKYFNNQ